LTRGEVSSIAIKIPLTREITATTNVGKRRRIKRNEQRKRRKILHDYEKLWKIV
jgi:hypothetical protein